MGFSSLVSPPMSARSESMLPKLSPAAIGWAALVLSVLSISWSALFVRLSDVGPLQSAFWRMAIAMPALYAISRAVGGKETGKSSKGGWGYSVAAGLCFAADLAFFHLAIGATSIVNASFIANMASIFAVAASAIVLKERVGPIVWMALAVALFGAWLMGGGKFDTSAFGYGDAMALGAAVVYAAYFLFIKQAQAHISSAEVMWRSSLVAAIAVFAIALVHGGALWPKLPIGWLPLLGLGLVSHALGQGLTAFVLGRLPVTPVAFAVLSQPVISTVLAAIILSEPVGLLQAFGAALILISIALTRFKTR